MTRAAPALTPLSTQSAFLALLRKDARLSLDVLRPWAVVLIAGGLLLVGITRLPESLVGSVSQVSLSDLFRFLGIALAATAAPVAILISASIVHGDRVHGASTLAAVLPRGRVERGLSATAMALAGSALVGVVAIGVLLGADAAHPDGIPRWTSRETGWFALITALAGGGIGFWSAPVFRRRWHAALVSCVLVALFGLMGSLIARWGMPVLLPGLADAVAMDDQGATGYPRLRDEAARVGLVGGVIAAGAACWCLGALGASGWRRARGLLAWAAVCGAILLAVSLCVPALLRTEAIVESWGYATRVAERLDAAEVARLVDRRVQPRPLSTDPVGRQAQAELQLLWIAVQRIATLPEAERRDHPAVQRLDELRREGSPIAAQYAIWALPQFDSRRLLIALEFITERDSADHFESWVLMWVDPDWWARPEGVSVDAARRVSMLEAAIAGLERLLSDPHSVFPPAPRFGRPESVAVDASIRDAAVRALPVLRRTLDNERRLLDTQVPRDPSPFASPSASPPEE